ncbi:Chloride channel CLIC-like protein 1 [Merluccius polli]|uniref:Chloride channel CLIC-like protein 1 n=1 Tax=Merluccius polli TaxID=89951 RepID=A0AA47MN66_MERPO|nr:Chloride channel CLIC-like protein 1 [Merluccius polli]
MVGLRLVVVVVVFSLAGPGRAEDDWIDPYDMLNYDASTKTMKTHPELREQQAARVSQQPTCSSVFKRLATRFLKLMDHVGLPTDNEDTYYNVKVKITRQGVAEVQKFLKSDDGCQNGAMANALSQLLMDIKPLDYEAWKWHFEDSFGVEIDTVLKVLLGVCLVVAIICTELWCVVSWFVQFKRMFAVCFFTSIVWNWFYLYKIEFAKHQSSLATMDTVYEKCTGMRKIDWSDSLKEWFRSTWTFQDDPCKRYYEVLMVNPILLVPPTKAIAVTFTTFITEPLKHVGQGISEFLRALLKDLPLPMQIPVFLTIMLSTVVVMYAVVQAVFQYGIMAPLRGPPPVVAQLQPAQPQPSQLQQAQVQPAQPQPAQLQQAQVQPAQPQPAQLQQAQVQPAQPQPAQRQQAQVQPAQPQPAQRQQAQVQPPQPKPDQLRFADPWAAGDAPQRGQEERAAGGVLRQRRPQKTGEAAAAAAPPRVLVETLGDEGYSQDEMDATEPVVRGMEEEVLRRAGNRDSDEEDEEEEVLRQPAPRTVAQDAKKQAEAKAKPSDLKPNLTTKDQKPAGSTGAQSLGVSSEISERIAVDVETVGSPVQETSPKK